MGDWDPHGTPSPENFNLPCHPLDNLAFGSELWRANKCYKQYLILSVILVQSTGRSLSTTAVFCQLIGHWDLLCFSVLPYLEKETRLTYLHQIHHKYYHHNYNNVFFVSQHFYNVNEDDTYCCGNRKYYVPQILIFILLHSSLTLL